MWCDWAEFRRGVNEVAGRQSLSSSVASVRKRFAEGGGMCCGKTYVVPSSECCGSISHTYISMYDRMANTYTDAATPVSTCSSENKN